MPRKGNENPVTEKERKPRKTYSQEEKTTYKSEGRTRGRKGCGRDRINMAFAPDVFDYIRTMSSASGQSMTQFVDLVLRKSMADNAELYHQAKALTEILKAHGLVEEVE